jgi:hypothetical protein
MPRAGSAHGKPVLQTVDEMLKSSAPDVRRLLGVEGQFGQSLGLTNDWAYRIIRAVGNYGESFERNVGQGSPLKIARGLNALWTKGRIARDHFQGAARSRCPPRR